jgi:hypothetical protein
MALPADGYLEDNARTEGTMKTAMEDILEAVKMIPGAGITVKDETIASGNITPSAGGNSLVIALAGESGADDTLDTITSTNVEDGAFLVLMRSVPGGDIITINSQPAGGTDSISLSEGSTDFLLDQDDKYLVLRYDLSDAKYYEMWRSWGTQTTQDAAFRAHFGFGTAVNGVDTGTGATNIPLVSDILGPDTPWVPADSMYAQSTNGCQTPIDQVELTAGQPERRVFWFDGSANEYAQFSVAMPKSWDEGTIYARFFFATTSTSGSNTCIWQLAAIALSHSDPLQTAFSGAQSVTTTLAGTANDLNVSAWLATPVTVGGSPAEGDLTYFQVGRLGASDTEPLDCGLIGMQFRYVSDALNDAP